MMVRVTLGHGGRPLHAPGAAVLAFHAVTAAALTRTFAPLLVPGLYRACVMISGALLASSG